MSLTRRRFLLVVPALGGAALVGCATPPAARDGGLGVVKLTFAAHPELMTIDGGVVVTEPAPIAVVRTGATTAVALGGLCSRDMCPLTYAQQGRLLLCTCDGSQFDLGGGVAKGPARLPLAVFPATVQSDGVAVDLG